MSTTPPGLRICKMNYATHDDEGRRYYFHGWCGDGSGIIEDIETGKIRREREPSYIQFIVDDNEAQKKYRLSENDTTRLQQAIDEFRRLEVLSGSDPFLTVFDKYNNRIVSVRERDYDLVLRAAKETLRKFSLKVER